MSSLSPQISSFSNPFSISFDSIEFSLDINQSIPNIMNSNNDYLINDPNAFVSKNALFSSGAEAIIGEKKVGGEPLKQYFSALANGSDGTNVLPIPDKKITYGIYNVAFRENNCSIQETSEIQVPELSNNTVATPPSTTFVHQQLSGEYYSSQRSNANVFPPSPVSPKFRSMNNNSSPYSYIDSNITLTPSSRNETSTPISFLTHNSSIHSNNSNSTLEDDGFTQCNYENNATKNTTYYYNTMNPQMNQTQSTLFSNVNDQKNMGQPQPLQSQNLYYINVNDQWKLQNPHENSCLYARRKQELKHINSPVQLKQVKVETEQIVVTNSPNYSQGIIPQEATNANDVKLSFQCPSNYQVQVSLQQPQPAQTNIQAGGNPTWATTTTTGPSNIICGQGNGNVNACVPQVIFQSNSVQQIIVQPTQNLVYQPNTSTIVNDTNANGLVFQQQQPAQVIVQSQVPPPVAVSNMGLNTVSTSIASTSSSSTPLQTPSQQLQTHIQCPSATSSNTIQQVVVQLQSLQNSNTNANINVNLTPIQTPIHQQTMIPSVPGLASPITPVSIKQEYGSNIKIENSLTANSDSVGNIDGIKIKEEPKIITPISSPILEETNKERQTIVINLANYKPINSHLDNFKNHKPAVLKFVPVKNKSTSVTRRRIEGNKIMKNSNSVYKCDVCKKEFLKYYQMKSHIKIHMTEKPFKCEYCTRAFCRKHDLARHVRIHTGDTPYICSNCFKGFARSDACTRHVRQNLCKSNIINYNPETKKVEVAI